MGETDPARELADICVKLRVQSKDRGDLFLANQFGVNAWSTEFYQIIFTISHRADELVGIIQELPLDEDFRKQAAQHVREVQKSFSPTAFQGQWANAVGTFLSDANLNPIKMLSGLVRTKYSYPKLDARELDELRDQVRALQGWLVEHQLHEQDFIRQALMDGLGQFLFRLEKMEWLGWGYTLQSLRDVITAYMALERGFTDPQASPTAQAMMTKTLDFVRYAMDKIGCAKDLYEKGDFLLKAYGAVMLLTQGSQKIAGLLTHIGA